MESPKQQILVADRETEVVKSVQKILLQEGFDVETAASGEAAVARIRTECPDLLIVEVAMPRMSGLDVCRQVRQEPATAHLPILFLSAQKEEVDRIVALELGADDFVAKPFSGRELVLRVRAILRRSSRKAPQDDRLQLGQVTLRTERREVLVDGRECDMTVIEFKLLAAMMSKPGQVLSRDLLQELVWGQEKRIEMRTIDTQVRRLRAALGKAGDQIQTIRAFGYRIVADRQEAKKKASSL